MVDPGIETLVLPVGLGDVKVNRFGERLGEHHGADPLYNLSITSSSETDCLNPHLVIGRTNKARHKSGVSDRSALLEPTDFVAAVWGIRTTVVQEGRRRYVHKPVPGALEVVDLSAGEELLCGVI